jgi:geranyl-CoA carboxylase alpha subunit
LGEIMSARFSSLLIANRGEIACRILRAARADGLRAIAVYSDADANAPHVRLADVAVRLGAAPLSYLSIPALIEAARATGAEAVHPGYGFLAENAEFAQAVLAAGLAFVGPPPAAIRAMGGKSAAKARMAAAGVPVAPGYHGEDQSFDRFAAEAERVGYPVMVKASAGGGGRGLRIVREGGALRGALETARAEAASAFGDGTLLIERALLGARHVEIQVLGDEHGHIVHLGERDCSIQRRHQKLVEEAPAVPDDLRARMGEAAVRAAAEVGYVGAGTVEFLLDAAGAFYFLEMNTRIQVEHPVTEAVTGRDLVALQLHVAQGRALPFAQGDVALCGHAIEARLCAEDADFMPAVGPVLRFTAPAGVRVDSGVETGGEVTPHYDSLLAKIIAYGDTREAARRKLVQALEGVFVAGLTTNRDALMHMLTRPDFINGPPSTDFLRDNPFTPGEPSALALALAAVLFVGVDADAPTAGWREAVVKLGCDGLVSTLHAARAGADWRIGDLTLRIVERVGDEVGFVCGGVRRRARCVRDGDDLWLHVEGSLRRFTDLTYAAPRRADALAGGEMRSPVSGVVASVEARTGDAVKRGQQLAVVEAMKMQHALLCPLDGVVAQAHAVAGQTTKAGALLFLIAGEQE